jgi:hypothetical protein
VGDRLGIGGTVARQARNNEETAGHWELYAGHRRRLTDAIETALDQAGGGRLCILGAGNANDLDLPRLRRRAREVHLVDLDRLALERATARAAGPGAPLVVHGPVDVSGLAVLPLRWCPAPPTAAERTRLPSSVAAAVAGALPGPFDVVVSDCLLTQIYETCFRALGPVDWLSEVLDLALAIHLRVMMTLGAPAGRGLLATDALSSETFPLDELFDAGEPLALLHALGREGRLFTGTKPGTLLPALRRAGAEDPRLVAPWLWREARACTLLVYAVTFGMGGFITRSG